MANYDNSRYTYDQVLAGTGYYMKDDLLRYSAGVKTMQGKLNTVGYNCGTPDGKFGSGTDTAVRNFQRAKNLTVDGKAGKGTLKALEGSSSTDTGYDNSRYTYAQVLAGTGYYMQDSKLRYSAGVKTMQEKLNKAGYNCGTPDGKFGSGTDTAVRNFQRAKGLTVDGKAGKGTLKALDTATSGGSSSSLYCSNSFLSLAQMKVNAQYILNYLRNRGWTKNAVCGMLGNMQTESTINPGVWQDLKANNTSVGFGLVQWTPATKYINWANSQNLEVANMDSQLKRILYELENGEQYYPTSAYNLSFSAFSKSTNSAYYLACAFLHNYEKPKDSSQDETRGNQATYWYNNLT